MASNQLDLASLSAKSSEEIFSSLKTSEKGLTLAEAGRRLDVYGPNEFSERRKIRPFMLLLSKFKSPLLLLLVGAAIVSGVLGSHIEAGIILLIVFLSVLIDFFNTYRSAKAVEALQEKVNITAAVVRNGVTSEESIHAVVPGDIVTLAAGDLVPADGILVSAKDLFIDESTLTGESMPVEKEATAGVRTVYLGTSVVSGEGTVVVVVTGAATKMGSIAGKLVRPDVPTEFERNLKDFSLFIFRTTLFLVLAVILLNIFYLGRDMLQIFLFAVAIAVGLTPELLPLIVTSNLAKGALRMSKRGVIVKKLAAIHNFGSIDVLCTDKTGTLTEDRIELIKCLDGLGKESPDVLFFGYLSGVHRTGVRNTLDLAIENYKKVDIRGWDKLDEVPFDAERRFESVVVRRSLAPDGAGHGTSGKAILIAKGAPENILKFSSAYGAKGEKLTEKLKTEIAAEYETLSRDGFRVLGVGIRNVKAEDFPFSKKDERDFAFIGFLAFLDPPKRTVKATLGKMEAHHVGIKIITGDNLLVTEKIAKEIGLTIVGTLTGDEIARLSDYELKKRVDEVNIFARVVPEQKEAIIRALQANGRVVAYMGDGVNDVLSLKAADVGISVNNAVDVAKETADIILVHPGLEPIIDGVVEGRKTFANTFKYLMMGLSSNFGNMFSMPIASVFLPFLPMTAPQILLNNFLYDASQLAIPFDNVEKEFLERPKKFDIGFMKKFMIIFGPLSSCFDFITYGVLFFVLRESAGGFQTGWFLESIATQTLVVNIIRTRGRFWRHRPSAALFFASIAAVATAWILPFTQFGVFLGFTRFNAGQLLLILGIVAVYLGVVECVKAAFYKKYGGLIEK